MKTQAQVNANAVDRWSYEDVVEKRAISRMLLNMLVAESDYRLAAELVSGAADLFRSYEGQIDEIIRCAGIAAMGCEEQLESLLYSCRAEISYERKWSALVLSGLPDHGGTAVLRAAFASVEAAGASLLQEVESATDRYREARADAVIF